LHRDTCRAAWDSADPPGSYARLVVELRCVVRTFASAHRMCNEANIDWARVFGRYGGRHCSWAGGQTRVFTMLRVRKVYERVAANEALMRPQLYR
jgi:hypothetical protein